MKVRFKESLARDLGALKDKALVGRIRAVVEQVEKVEGLADVTGLKKLRGGGGGWSDDPGTPAGTYSLLVRGTAGPLLNHQIREVTLTLKVT